MNFPHGWLMHSLPPTFPPVFAPCDPAPLRPVEGKDARTVAERMGAECGKWQRKSADSATSLLPNSPARAHVNQTA